MPAILSTLRGDRGDIEKNCSRSRFLLVAVPLDSQVYVDGVRLYPMGLHWHVKGSVEPRL